jgi:hypothetical protein
VEAVVTVHPAAAGRWALCGPGHDADRPRMARFLRAIEQTDVVGPANTSVRGGCQGLSRLINFCWSGELLRGSAGGVGMRELPASGCSRRLLREGRVVALGGAVLTLETDTTGVEEGLRSGGLTCPGWGRAR